MSCGVEDAEDLKADTLQALEKAVLASQQMENGS
jgi:cystathionine gamma-lyase